MRAAMAALLWLQLAIGAGGQLPDEPLCGPEDVNSDGSVGVGDLLLVLSAFGGSDAAADINGDGEVKVRDVLLVLEAFGLPCRLAGDSPAPPRLDTFYDLQRKILSVCIRNFTLIYFTSHSSNARALETLRQTQTSLKSDHESDRDTDARRSSISGATISISKLAAHPTCGLRVVVAAAVLCRSSSSASVDGFRAQQ